MNCVSQFASFINGLLYEGRAFFKVKAYDDAYEAAEVMPDSPERTKLYQEMARIMVAYAPWKINIHRISHKVMFCASVPRARPVSASKQTPMAACRLKRLPACSPCIAW